MDLGEERWLKKIYRPASPVTSGYLCFREENFSKDTYQTAARVEICCYLILTHTEVSIFLACSVCPEPELCLLGKGGRSGSMFLDQVGRRFASWKASSFDPFRGSFSV